MSAKASGKRKAQSGSSGVAKKANDTEPETHTCTGVNDAIYTKLQGAWATIEKHPVFADITNHLPLGIAAKGESGTQASFKDTEYDVAMKKHKSYECGINVFWGSLFFNPRPLVPLRMSAIEQHMSTKFPDGKAPTKFPQTLVFAMREKEAPLDLKGQLKRISPEEPLYSAVLQSARASMLVR